ncbi:hypothetical protein H8M03_04215 [Sphingomonas sabuli]|uniref:Uncharacterized protein n=1 Tax=Sphingomonas sabuli TaxID=2764186 RepID=A0A7G9L4J3_9SPHN|nr:hypothetical protein [Sphingomonas sabuli]QNM83542.1 hypothetical protein H8M03_04215 [Sphingomonas sabuli]
MHRATRYAALAALAASACGAAAQTVPRGATIGPGGFATILDAPPAPVVPAAADAPAPATPDQRAAEDRFRRAGEFQNRVMEEAQALHRTLDRREKGNFVDLYFENEGDPHVVFRFLRDPERTLARHTSNPDFRAARAQYAESELRAVLDAMMTAFAADRVIEGGGTGNKENRVVLDLLVREAEFRDLAARKGIAIPDSVVLRSRFEGTTAAAANWPLPAYLAQLVRAFPRSDRPVGIVHAIDSRVRIALVDGCFRSPDHGNALVQLPMGASLFIDRDGYLAFGSAEVPGARVGEAVVSPGSVADVTAPELAGPINAACGPGRIIAVNALRSAAADGVRQRLTTNANALRELKESYGLTHAQAVRALESCKAAAGAGTCLPSPPPPVAREEDCPPGTSLSFGLCRTPEGYIRPLPRWLEPFAGR